MRNNDSVFCDTGPLVALYDPFDHAQRECRAALEAYHGKLLTTWPVITEAMYLLGRQDRCELLWELILGGGLEPVEIPRSDIGRIRGLMARYSDLPMDLADASLVAAAERLQITRIFTLDHHFRVYRPRHTRAFEVLP